MVTFDKSKSFLKKKKIVLLSFLDISRQKFLLTAIKMKFRNFFNAEPDICLELLANELDILENCENNAITDFTLMQLYVIGHHIINIKFIIRQML